MRCERAQAAAEVAAANARDAERATQSRREAAWKLTRIAEEVAREGQCAEVSRLDSEVRTLDAEFHAEVFLADLAIQRCLATRLEQAVE